MFQLYAPIYKREKDIHKHFSPPPVSLFSFLASVGYYNKLPWLGGL